MHHSCDVGCGARLYCVRCLHCRNERELSSRLPHYYKPEYHGWIEAGGGGYSFSGDQDIVQVHSLVNKPKHY